MSLTGTSVLQYATKQQLEQAIAENHRQLFLHGATANRGEIVNDGAFVYTYVPEGAASILFPAPETTDISTLLDNMMDYYRLHPPKNIGYWALEPAQPADISVRLLARGFQLGWQPCWMFIDLEKINTGFPAPEGLEIRIDNNISVHEIKDLPYGDSETITDVFLRLYPDRAQRVVGLLDGKVVGHNCLFFTTGPDGVAGLYNVGTLPAFQKQGIGKALVVAACQYARERGYRYATLNANHIGRRTYEQVGFEFLSYGLTWWIVNHHFITDPPSAHLVALTEATGRGDIAMLDEVGSHFTAADLSTRLINGMTLLELAGYFKQFAAAEWLIAHGVVYTPLEAWTLGWKDRAAALLAHDPSAVNQLYYEWGGTLLHVAAMKGDLELAKLALAYNVDLSIKDKEHDSYALGWAYYFGRVDMIGLIKEHMDHQ